MSKSESVFGIHSVSALLQHAPERALELFVQKDRDDPAIQEIVKAARQAGVRPQFCQRKTLDDRVQEGTHQGVLLIVTPGRVYQENDLPELAQKAGQKALFLVLDQVTDPHNLGACLRTADAAAVTAVIVPKDRAASLNATVRKVASGAAEIVPLVTATNLARAIRILKDEGVWVTGTAGEATATLYENKFIGPVALVMGAEGAGMRRLTRELCDDLIAIPLAGTVSSLNVSVAAGVCLFEVVRQRNAAK
ncbi:23S rRNA (guanosine(2251)-2'-O)-methyltransferase RlmB [Aliidiomarina iranensis]|uniref:23S rRNA (guanosine-2'-O-)-methyltransferase RlmB n=1 Tax=Aliidiomarina iranensis TaxID=1434071 RepID=A0A432VUL0_9GAMM|nr:23S rRNA (guanosine(2251)-2'-O)-methyltransferase RlmB [Aliidiomarina iranensis]RUO20026.1 23S rRNA (guanosine(2251)-2'-O)-methyltransferase RlmB [Aliidiomarina iranensis]